MTVADETDGANISLENLTGAVEQKFTLYANPDGSYALLSATSDNKSCADVFGISLETGANICQWNYWGGAGQKFVIEPAVAETLMGDVNSDGKVNVSDAVLLQKWLLGVQDKNLTDWHAGDFNGNGILDVFDLVLMRKAILNS